MNCMMLHHLGCVISPETIRFSVTADCSATATDWPTEDTWTNIAIGTVSVTVAILQLVLGNRIANVVNRMWTHFAVY
jgi:hypothetical protein